MKKVPITVNLCVKEQEGCNYIPFPSFRVNVDEDINFIKNIVKEVKSLSRKQKKTYTKIVKSFIGTTISFLALSSRSMANTLNQPQIELTTALPQELLEPLMDMIKLALGGSLLLTILLLIASGVMRQFRKKKEASEWTTDIIKGFIQILIATPLIFLLYFIVTRLLGNFSQFLNPF